MRFLDFRTIRISHLPSPFEDELGEGSVPLEPLELSRVPEEQSGTGSMAGCGGGEEATQRDRRVGSRTGQSFFGVLIDGLRNPSLSSFLFSLTRGNICLPQSGFFPEKEAK